MSQRQIVRFLPPRDGTQSGKAGGVFVERRAEPKGWLWTPGVLWRVLKTNLGLTGYAIFARAAEGKRHG